MKWWTFVGYALAPFGVVGFVWLGAQIKVLILRHMKNGWLKDQLLRERWHSAASDTHRRITGGQDSFR